MGYEFELKIIEITMAFYICKIATDKTEIIRNINHLMHTNSK